MISAISSVMSGAGLSVNGLLGGGFGTPLTRGGLVAATLTATVKNKEVKVACHFNPSQFAVSKTATWNPEEQIGFNIPKMTFKSGAAKTLPLELIFDTQGTMAQGNVRKVTDQLWKFILVDTADKDTASAKTRPPEVTFKWSDFEFKGAVTTMTHTYTLFNELGVPLRAKVNLTLQEIEDQDIPPAGDGNSTALRAKNTAAALASGMVGTSLAMASAATQSLGASTNSSSSKPSSSGSSVAVQSGTRIDHVAAATTGDSSNQRKVAENNNIDNPMKMPKGQVIS